KSESYSAFGWIVENKFLFDVLNAYCAKQKNITHIRQQRVSNIDYQEDKAIVTLENDTKYEAALIIGADGRQSFTRKINNIPTKKWSYNQKAVICAATHENPHHNIAIEHFRSDGPFAILPMMDKADGSHQSAVVWTLHKDDSMNIINDSDIFLTALNERFPSSYGDVTQTSTPQIYPLSFNHAYEYITHRTALIGDAAHGIHPIAGQGLNIGLQDVKALHKTLSDLQSNKKDIGQKDNLKVYEQMRKPDNTAMAAATDLLNRLFSNNITPIKLIRQKGLKIIERVTPSKKFFIQRAMGIKDT
ncbi:MAG: FAD-dependent monooxygenase, partial [Pseudomonadota bacterium]